MTPKTTFTQIVSPSEEKSADQFSVSPSAQVRNGTVSRDLVRARIEYLLEWAERESLPSSLINPQSN